MKNQASVISILTRIPIAHFLSQSHDHHLITTPARFAYVAQELNELQIKLAKVELMPL